MSRRDDPMLVFAALLAGDASSDAQARELLSKASAIVQADRPQLFELLLRTLVMFCDGSSKPVEVMRAAIRCFELMIELELAIPPVPSSQPQPVSDPAKAPS